MGVWFGGLVGAIIGVVLAAIGIAVAIILSEHKKQQAGRDKILNRLDTADMLLQENMTADALAIYTSLLKEVSKEKDSETYALIKNSEGKCYYNLSFRAKRAENLIKAIAAFEDSAKFSNPQKSPDSYALTCYNLGSAYMNLSEFHEEEKSLKKAAEAFRKT
ncbi:MAG TPA: hypothetical protein DHW81_04575, partial [Nitrospiraceae bacterium]|nr:hypothetical protein [Nitrospiraceae bacterium]